MQQLPEFIINHPFLFSALAAVLTFIIVTELRRSSGAKSISVTEAIRLINQEDAVILDVRGAGEYKTGHILNAKNIPIDQLDERLASLKIDKLTPIIAYCKTGNISSTACSKILALGYEHVVHIKNGLYSWQDANLPMTK